MAVAGNAIGNGMRWVAVHPSQWHRKQRLFACRDGTKATEQQKVLENTITTPTHRTAACCLLLMRIIHKQTLTNQSQTNHVHKYNTGSTHEAPH
jgi:hypothetical protein